MPVEITSRDNAAVKDAVKLMSGAKERRASGRFIAEGARLCREAMENTPGLQSLFYTSAFAQREPELLEALEESAEKSFIITEDISRKISDTVTPQGVFCVGKINPPALSVESMKRDGQYILLENLQDPSNLGAVFRTAEALGIDGAMLSADCCDPFNPKAMRASMGAVFRFPYFVSSDHIEEVKRLKEKHMRVMASVPDESAGNITAIRFFRGVVMCIGNEGGGLSDRLISACGERVTIPMRGRAESLNAATAASILMWEMVRNY